MREFFRVGGARQMVGRPQKNSLASPLVIGSVVLEVHAYGNHLEVEVLPTTYFYLATKLLAKHLVHHENVLSFSPMLSGLPQLPSSRVVVPDTVLK